MLLYYGDRYDHPTRIWVGTDLYVLTTDPDEVQVVLNSPESLNRDTVYKYVMPLMGNGLVTLPAEKWKNHRRMINPTFNRHVLKSYIPIFNKETNTLTELISNEIGKSAFDIYKFMDRCTLDTICRKNYSIIVIDTIIYWSINNWLLYRDHYGNGNACSEKPKQYLFGSCK